MSLAIRMQAARLRQAALYPGQGVWRVYVNDTELLNVDQSTPYLKQLEVNESMAVSAMAGVVEDVAFWLVRHLGEAQNVNQAWALSLDSGEAGFQVECVRREVVTAETALSAPVYEYTLKGNPGNAVVSLPSSGPVVLLAVAGSTTRALGDPSDILLEWTVTSGRSAIASITVVGESITLTGDNNQSGTVSAAPTLNAPATYTAIAITEDEEIVEAVALVERKPYYYWGLWDGVGAFDAADLLALDGGGDGVGLGIYGGNLNQSFDMDGQGSYFVWVLPQGESVSFSTAFGPLTDNVLVYEGSLFNPHNWPEPVQVWRTQSRQASKSILIIVQAS